MSACSYEYVVPHDNAHPIAMLNENKQFMKVRLKNAGKYGAYREAIPIIFANIWLTFAFK